MAEITVVNTNDSGAGSLRQAIIDATSSDTINFALPIPSTITLISGQIYIAKNLNINGLGANNLIINGNNASRVFEIASGYTVTFRGISIINGYDTTFYDGGAAILNKGTITVKNCNFLDNSVTYNGGAITNYGTITIENCTFVNNKAKTFGGAIFNLSTAIIINSTFNNNTSDYAGAVFNRNGCTIIIENCTLLYNNASTYYGGAVHNGGMAFIENSTISNNSAAGSGGAVQNDYGGIITIKNSTISNNSASNYGGAFNNTGTINVEASTISNNSASSDGGAAYNNGTINVETSTLSNNNAGNYGGAIYNVDIINVINSTLSNNNALSGGAIRHQGGESAKLNITFSTIAENRSQEAYGGGIYNYNWNNTIAFKNSIVANNYGNNFDGLGAISVSGVNFDTDGTCPGFTRVTASELKLGSLAMNLPGTTETHALLRESVAIGTAADCTDLDGNVVSTDQRGVSRPQGTAGDPGAYEYNDGPGPSRGIPFLY